LSDIGDYLRQSLSSTALQRRLQHLEEQMAQLRMQVRPRIAGAGAGRCLGAREGRWQRMRRERERKGLG
jgi:hypothetical protein